MKKKLLPKLSIPRKKKQLEAPAGRITTDTLAEHREQVLAGGRKFKYPIQYQKHKLVVNTIIIAVAALLLLLGLGWYMLYVAQSTSEFMYRVTKVVPVPAAFVDGKAVRYSDYLMKYRSAAHYLTEKEQIDTRSDDGKRQLAYVKTQAMNDAVADAYATKLAHENRITVSDSELETFLTQQRKANGVSESTYDAVIEDYYGWSPDEYRDAMRMKLRRQKVAYAVDTTAEKTTNTITARLKAGDTTLEDIAKSLNTTKKDSVSYTAATWVPKDNQDGGLATTAAKLKAGQVSAAIKNTSGDGYYFVKLLEINDTQLRYEYIHVPLTVFSEKLDAATKGKSLVTLITLEDTSSQDTNASTAK